MKLEAQDVLSDIDETGAGVLFHQSAGRLDSLEVDRGCVRFDPGPTALRGYEVTGPLVIPGVKCLFRRIEPPS